MDFGVAMTPDERQQEEDLQHAMLEEVDQLIQDAKKRPITDDEAQVLCWHCGLLDRSYRRHA